MQTVEHTSGFLVVSFSFHIEPTHNQDEYQIYTVHTYKAMKKRYMLLCKQHISQLVHTGPKALNDAAEILTVIIKKVA